MSDPVAGPATTAATVRAGESGGAPPPAPGAADSGLSAVFEALPGPTAVFAADPPHFTLLAASDALLAAVGRTRAALVGRPLAEAFPDPDPAPPEGSGVASLRASLAAAVRTGRPQRMARQRYDLQRPDGTWEARYWDALNTPVPGPDGAVRAVLHQTEDVTERVRSEHAAARADVRAARVLERMSDAHVALDRDFHVTYVNAAAERALGRPRGELLGRSHWEVFPASVDSDVGRAYRRVAAEGVAQHVRQHYVGEGYDRHVELDAFPTDEGEGAGRGVAVFWRDVTARVRAEAALRQSEAKYRALFASIDAGFCVIEILVDDDGRPVDYRFLETNPAFVHQTGLADAAGRTIRELAPAIEPHWSETYGRVAATGEPVRFEAPAEALGRWYDVYAFRVDRPEDRRVAVLFTDVTAHKAADRERTRLLAAERAARAEAERLAARTERLQALTAAALAAPLDRGEAAHAILREVVAAAGAAGGGVLELTADGREFVLLDLAGYDEDAVRPAYGRFPADLPTPARDAARDLRPIFLRRREDWAAGGYLSPEPSPAAAAGAAWAALPLAVDGRALGVLTLTFGEPRAFGADEQAFVMAFARQCAQAMQRAALYDAERAARAEAEAARRDAEAAQARAEAAGREADEANQAKSGFLAVMSHELRTPINAMLGYTQLLELGLAGPLTDQQRGYLDRLTASSHHLLGLVNDVLDLSKIEAGETRVARRDATTGAATRAALDLVRPQADARGVRLVDARPDDDGVPFVGDEDRVRQVVLNLLGNAVKFTPAGGTVTVTCGTEAATPAAAGHLQGVGPWAYVRVADTGVGIPSDEQGRIFDPFHQVDSRHTRKAGGTGLGLAISRRLARLMGGDLTVESAPGAGSTFTLWLPAARRAAGAPPETAAARSARAERDVARDVAALETPGLGDVGEALRASVDEVLAAYADRLRADPAVPHARAMRRVELEDHAVSFCADLAQSLVIVGHAGPQAAGMLRDGSAIQRAIAEQHGARRYAQGFDEAAVRRDHELLREEVERAVRGRLRLAGGGAGGHAPGDAGAERDVDRDVDAAVRVLLGLIDRAEAISVRAWRQAASHTTDAGVA